jgi:hypothetical protein
MTPKEALYFLYQIANKYAYGAGNDDLVDKVFDTYAIIAEYIKTQEEGK